MEPPAVSAELGEYRTHSVGDRGQQRCACISLASRCTSSRLNDAEADVRNHLQNSHYGPDFVVGRKSAVRLLSVILRHAIVDKLATIRTRESDIPRPEIQKLTAAQDVHVFLS